MFNIQSLLRENLGKQIIRHFPGYEKFTGSNISENFALELEPGVSQETIKNIIIDSCHRKEIPVEFFGADYYIKTTDGQNINITALLISNPRELTLEVTSRIF